MTITETIHLLLSLPFLTRLQPQWPCWFQNIPGWSLCTCFLLPRLTLFLPGLLSTCPPQVFVHILLSCSGLHCPLIYNHTPQLLGFLHSSYYNLPNSIFLFCLLFLPQECEPCEDRDFYLFGHSGYPMARMPGT